MNTETRRYWERRLPLALMGLGTVLRVVTWWRGGDFTFDELGMVAGWPGVGGSERGMRVLSLAASIAALPLMYAVGRRLVGRAGGVFSLAALALLGPAIRGSAEVGGGGAFGAVVTLAILRAYLACRESRARWARGCAWGLLLAGGLLLCWEMDWCGRRDGMMPWSVSAVPWASGELMGLFAGALGWEWPVVGFAAWGIGMATMAVVRPKVFALMLTPLLLMFVGAGLHWWGVGSPAVLVPWVVLGIGGVMLRNEKSPISNARLRRAALAGVAAAVLGIEAAGSLAWPGGREEISVVLRGMAHEVKEGDEVYVYHGAGRGFDHYAARCGMTAGRVARGRDRGADFDAFEKDVAEMRGRVWVVFSHVPGGLSRDGRLMALLPAAEEVIEARGAGAYLVEVRK